MKKKRGLMKLGILKRILCQTKRIDLETLRLKHLLFHPDVNIFF